MALATRVGPTCQNSYQVGGIKLGLPQRRVRRTTEDNVASMGMPVQAVCLMTPSSRPSMIGKSFTLIGTIVIALGLVCV